MPENNLVSLNVDESMIREIVNKQITQGIVTALGDPAQYMEAIISKALRVKVDERGKVSDYSSYNKYDYLEVLLQQNIRAAVDEAIKEWIAENKNTIKTALKKHMEKEKVRTQFLDAFVKGAEECFTSGYSIDCEVKFQSPKEGY